MLNRTQFRFLVILAILFGIISIIAALLGESSLPPELQEYLANYYEKEFSTLEFIFLGIAIICLISNIFVLFFFNWARNIFTISLILSMVGMIFDEAIIQTNFETAFVELSIFTYGIVVACMYFTDIKTYFK
jgi:hypothetical protein